MGFAAKLRDVEQQLSRVAGVVQLHVQLGASYGGSVGQESGVSELVESVERARGELNAATEQLLALARRSVDPSGEDGDTETEDEFEENARVKSEFVDLPDDKEVTSTVFDAVASDAQEATMEVGTTGVEAVDCGDVEEENGTTTLHDSSLGEQVVVQPGEQHSWDILASNFGFILYASFAERVKKKAKLGFLDADAALSCMSSRDIETWRQYVREYIACVHGKFLAYLRNGKVAREPVVLFSDATLLAVTLLTTRDKCRDRYWLLERAEELNDILHAAKIPPVVQMLRLVEKSHTDLVSYYISNFDDALEDMSEYVELVERHCMAEKKPMLPFLISLLRKFICDCVDYKLRQEVAIGMPRTEAQWARFHEIGVTLASWINAVATADIPHEMISRAINTERLRQFRDQFPGRIPEALLVAWRRVSSAKQEVAASKRGIELANVSGTRGGGAEIAIKHHSTDLPYTIPAPPFVWGPTRQFAKKRRFLGCYHKHFFSYVFASKKVL
ncbi:uncharacterized protein IUM83_17055 [Phytophthora cinnamomi]|uniref:uncharacterized protein n=1 Tax=Phytophthora cinnamomi TaxID=4785 RepID=UPI00355A5156|nr:hypothetical protein IUM83_17055 [Phytophthora cinnamomi]